MPSLESFPVNLFQFHGYCSSSSIFCSSDYFLIHSVLCYGFTHFFLSSLKYVFKGGYKFFPLLQEYTVVYESTLPDLLAFIMSYYDSLTSGREKKGGGAGAGPPPPQGPLDEAFIVLESKKFTCFPF